MLFYIVSIVFIIPAPAIATVGYTSTCNSERRKNKSERGSYMITGWWSEPTKYLHI